MRAAAATPPPPKFCSREEFSPHAKSWRVSVYPIPRQLCHRLIFSSSFRQTGQLSHIYNAPHPWYEYTNKQVLTQREFDFKYVLMNAHVYACISLHLTLNGSVISC